MEPIYEYELAAYRRDNELRRMAYHRRKFKRVNSVLNTVTQYTLLAAISIISITAQSHA